MKIQTSVYAQWTVKFTKTKLYCISESRVHVNNEILFIYFNICNFTSVTFAHLLGLLVHLIYINYSSVIVMFCFLSYMQIARSFKATHTCIQGRECVAFCHTLLRTILLPSQWTESAVYTARCSKKYLNQVRHGMLVE